MEARQVCIRPIVERRHCVEFSSTNNAAGASFCFEARPGTGVWFCVEKAISDDFCDFRERRIFSFCRFSLHWLPIHNSGDTFTFEHDFPVSSFQLPDFRLSVFGTQDPAVLRNASDFRTFTVLNIRGVCLSVFSLSSPDCLLFVTALKHKKSKISELVCFSGEVRRVWARRVTYWWR